MRKINGLPPELARQMAELRWRKTPELRAEFGDFAAYWAYLENRHNTAVLGGQCRTHHDMVATAMADLHNGLKLKESQQRDLQLLVSNSPPCNCGACLICQARGLIGA